MKKISLLAAVFLLTCFAAKSNTYTVSITADAGLGSLRAAIDSANANPGQDSIILALTTADTIFVQSAFDFVSDSLIITGLPCQNPTINGGNIGFNNSLFFVSNTGIPLTLNYLNFTNCINEGPGVQGGVVYSALLYLNYCCFSGNSAIDNFGGIGSEGGAVAGDVVTAYNCTFNGNNTASTNGPDEGEGGAVIVYSTADFYNCTFYNNQAGSFASAMYVPDAGNIINCTFAGNSITGTCCGGVIFNNGSPNNLNIANSIFWGNTSPGTYSGIWFVTNTNSGGCNILQAAGDNTYFVTTPSDSLGVNPLLGTFGYYGGCVPVLPILCGSVAQNHAACAGATASDARGVAAYGVRDAGAFEIAQPFIVNLGADTTVCGYLTLNAGTVGNDGAAYLWSTGAATQTINADTTGRYSVTVTDIVTSCTVADTIHVTVHPLPVISLSNHFSGCVRSYTLNAGNTGGHFLWSTGDTTQSITASTSGDYTVVVTDSNTCSSSASVNVYLKPVPYVNLGNDTTQCGGTVTLNAGNPGDDYQWSDHETTQIITVNSTNTYGVVVTDPNSGCSASALVNVTINQAPVVNLGGGIVQCGGTVTLDAVNPGDNYYWSDDSTHQTITVATSGTYSVTVTDPANGCTGAGSTNVYINPTPYVNLGNDTTQCGGTITLNAGNPGDLYHWNDNESTQIITVTSSNSYSVTVTDPNSGCTAVSGVSVQINPVPVINIPSSVTLCGGNAILNAGNPGDLFTWSNGTFTQADTLSTSGTYIVTVTDNGNGCSASATTQVYIEPAPYVNLGNNITQCGGTVTLDAGNPGDLYAWTDNENSQTITVNAGNNYGVTVTDPNSGCSAQSSVSVNILPVPVVNLGPDVTRCGGSVTLDAGNTGDTFNWSNGTSNETAVATTSGLYSVTVTNNFNCSTVDSINIYIQTVPTVYLGQDITQCGGFVTLDAGNPGYNYLWSTNATTQTTQVSISGTYSVTVTNPVNGCPASDTINVTIDTIPVVNLGPDTTQCGGPVTLNAGNAGATYVWSDNSTSQTLVVTASGIYRVTVTNSNGCTATGSITVTINPIPVVTLSLPANVCITVPPFALTGGLPLGGIYYEADTAITVFTPNQQGIGPHQITYVFANIYGCVDSDSASIYVRPQPFISTVSPPYLCTTSAEINLNNYFTPPGGSYTGIGVSQIFFYPNLSKPGIDTVEDIFTDNYGCMDTANYIIPVHAPVHVSLTSSVADFTICTSQSITFTATGAEFYQFFVNDSAQGTATADSTFSTTTLSNHSIIYVVGSNPCSTDTSEPIVIDVIVPPVVNAGNDTTINLGQTVQLHGTATGDGNLTYLWTPGTGLNFIDVPNPTYSGSDSITFWFKATDSYGCADSAQVSVYVFVPDNVLLPTVITPNGDGYNDVWKLNPKINLDGSHLTIFDRWGEIVFQTENYANNWAGTYKTLTGKLLPDDTYYYVLNVPAQHNHTYTGPINIISGKQ